MNIKKKNSRFSVPEEVQRDGFNLTREQQVIRRVYYIIHVTLQTGDNIGMRPERY